MNEQRFQYTTRYLKETFGASDAHLEGLMAEAVKRGLPNIAVSPDVGRLLMMLTSATRGRRALELGTLAGYSGIWLARGLREGGLLTTIEKNPEYADFAETQFERAGVGSRVEVRRGEALAVLAELRGVFEARSVDMVFVDAVKTEYPDYFAEVRSLIAPGGFFVADNILGAGDWWIDDEDHPSRRAVHQLSRSLAEDPDFDAVGVPLREGVLVARRKD